MKFTLAALALVAAAQAQSLADVPKCAIPCLDDAVESETSCETTDLACICKSFEDVRTAATSCVLEKCGSDVALNEVLPATEKLCKNPVSSMASSMAMETKSSMQYSMPMESSMSMESSAPLETMPSMTMETTMEMSSSVPPVISTPSVSSTGEAVATPSSTAVEVNGAAGLKGLGALAMAAFAALAL
ncbi:hypothetical protein FZEAL_4117 [Fusarium zealandicum]|uniref:CFEM domain-containing protein n=1 Tax=Fusarium zealandicum TaxID=1053134 RepID=A0A8H4XLR6_9HYPO|nr:hypothetical protein FZEAL_4117 [Fusarium zealandicum]